MRHLTWIGLRTIVFNHRARTTPKCLPKTEKSVRKAVSLLVGSALMLLAGVSVAGERFDGNWLTKLTCPPKGNTEGYAWRIPSVIQNNNFRGEHGTAGEPGYLLIEGKIAEDGSAKLAANGIVASRQYARGVFAHKGGEYSYDIKAQFKETEGTGTKSAGLGIEGRTCTFDFLKEQATSQAGGR
jgi:hypothetical protein